MTECTTHHLLKASSFGHRWLVLYQAENGLKKQMVLHYFLRGREVWNNAFLLSLEYRIETGISQPLLSLPNKSAKM